jgi:hypothetical protein
MGWIPASAGMTKRFRTSSSAGMTGKNGGMPAAFLIDSMSPCNNMKIGLFLSKN